MEQAPRILRQSEAEELVAMVAHDIRNPLSCIEGYAALLLDRDLPKEEREKLLRRILSCNRFAEQIVEDVLDLSAIERGQFVARKSTILLPEVLKRSLETLEPMAVSRQVKLVYTQTLIRHAVVADPVRIQQVIQNLVTNAVKHVKPGEGRIELRIHDLDGELVVEVADNGEGIDPSQLEKIFEKFYQADEKTRSSLGLGLYIAQQVVSHHGGKLWARSEGKGRGASFYFSLPKFDPERAYQEYKAARNQPTPPPRPSWDRAKLRRFSVSAAAIGAIAAAHLAVTRLLPDMLPMTEPSPSFAASVGPAILAGERIVDAVK